MNSGNYDPAELAKFSALAHRWWDPTSEFRPLHEINPLRLGHIERLAGGLSGKRVADVGCGGGILAEAMSAKGARVTGIDLAALELASIETVPCFDPASHVVYAAGREHVTHVWVEGKPRLVERRLQEVDEADVRDRAAWWQRKMA